ncbi:hypothetical protein ACFYSF_46005 [Streptomyces canus]|uniref:hypothetical protein n=1 Tax=Streptomyces canus TaxID=58343 RepID=UPI003699B4CE
MKALFLNRAGADKDARVAGLDAGLTDVITVGTTALANPDLLARRRSSAPLSEAPGHLLRQRRHKRIARPDPAGAPGAEFWVLGGFGVPSWTDEQSGLLTHPGHSVMPQPVGESSLMCRWCYRITVSRKRFQTSIEAPLPAVMQVGNVRDQPRPTVAARQWREPT